MCSDTILYEIIIQLLLLGHVFMIINRDNLICYLFVLKSKFYNLQYSLLDPINNFIKNIEYSRNI